MFHRIEGAKRSFGGAPGSRGTVSPLCGADGLAASQRSLGSSRYGFVFRFTVVSIANPNAILSTRAPDRLRSFRAYPAPFSISFNARRVARPPPTAPPPNPFPPLSSLRENILTAQILFRARHSVRPIE